VSSAGLIQLASALRKSALAFAGATVLMMAMPGLAGQTSFGTIHVEELPEEARRTEQLIRVGGPFPYAKDGAVFGNRERLLPRDKRGYYREYTVGTPGARDRGARRIVCGGDERTAPDACYYTADHYVSFKRIVQ
jgi:ribonuclease T1